MFQRNTKRSTITRTSEAYYILKLSDGSEIGGKRAALERYSRSVGETPDYVDGRKPTMRTTHGINNI